MVTTGVLASVLMQAAAEIGLTEEEAAALVEAVLSQLPEGGEPAQLPPSPLSNTAPSGMLADDTMSPTTPSEPSELPMSSESSLVQ